MSVSVRGTYEIFRVRVTVRVTVRVRVRLAKPCMYSNYLIKSNETVISIVLIKIQN